MTFALFLIALVVCLALCWRFLGAYLVAVYDGRLSFLGFIERPIYRLLGTSPAAEQTWKRYAGSMVIFCGLTALFTYADPRAPGLLPAQPPAPERRAPGAGLQHRRQFRHQHQLAELRRRDDHVVLLADRRAQRSSSSSTAGGRHRGRRRADPGLLAPGHRPPSGTSGSTSPAACSTCSSRSPSSLGIIFVGQGAVQTRWPAPVSVHDALNGVTQTIPRGPIGFMEAIKQLGTNGGGFLNTNSAHPFENPTGLTNLLSISPALAIPFALTYAFGKMVGQHPPRRRPAGRHGHHLRGPGSASRLRRAPAEPRRRRRAASTADVGNTEGKEVRFGDTSTPLFGVASTNTSTGSADALLRLVHPHRRLRPADRHDARRGRPRRRRQRALHDPHLRHHRRVHRRPHDRANAGVPGQEDPGARR